MPDPHRVLIVEDDAPTASLLAEYVRSLGMHPHVAATLDAVDAALADPAPICCVLLDKQIPSSPGAIPLTSTGDTAQKRLRARDPRRTPADHHVPPILIVTGASKDPAFVAKNFQQGASDFIPKPFDAETVTTQILSSLERAGRADHAQCAALGAPPRDPSEPRSPAPSSAPPSSDRVHLVLDAVRIGRRTSFSINGKRRDLQDALFATLLRLAAERARGSEAYLPKRELGILRAPEIPSRLREAVEDAVPAGFSILQRGDEGFFRLHPLVVVDAIDWPALERHPHPGIQGIAAAERKRR